MLACANALLLLCSIASAVSVGWRNMVKLLMEWDIRSGQEQAYFEFVMQEFAPGLIRLGLQPTEAWYTVYGNGRQILTGAVASDIETMRSILTSDDWQQLRDRLLQYVGNFTHKVIVASGRFQL
jgi:hypothetical protein